MTEDKKRERQGEKEGEREELLNQLERRDVNESKAPVTTTVKEMCSGVGSCCCNATNLLYI